MNHRLLVTGVLYRWAAFDQTSAVSNLLSYALQGALLLGVALLVPRIIFLLLSVLFFFSASVNAIHHEILGTVLDSSSLQWMLGESRQFLPAFEEFILQFLMGFGKALVAVGLIWLARCLFRWRVWRGAPSAGVFRTVFTTCLLLSLLLGADVLLGPFGRARAAEMNVYGMLARLVMDEAPDRKPVGTVPTSQPEITKIVWLVDESVGWRHFDEDLRPQWVQRWGGIDFGQTRSFANCSAQSNAALRWGVDVADVRSTSDLRTNSTIWAYARKAGFRTTLIDGQVRGSPQNYLWPKESVLIDDIRSSAAGLDTDRQIADQLNEILKVKGRDYVYVVLKGSHYQYYNNYPDGQKDRSLPLDVQYRRSIAYSKKDFLQSLFSGVDREKLAVFYTSDHGQHIENGTVPHCNDTPFPEEMTVPLMLFLPEALKQQHSRLFDSNERHAHSQIFPTTLLLMGYSKDYAVAQYDNPLPYGTQRLIRLGKRIVPSPDNKSIEIFMD